MTFKKKRFIVIIKACFNTITKFSLFFTFKIVSSEALPNRLRDCGESASDDAALDDDEDGRVCELLLLNLCGNVLDFSHLSLSPS